MTSDSCRSNFYLVLGASIALASPEQAYAGERDSPKSAIRDLFLAIERGDELALKSIMVSGSTIVEKEIPEAGMPCNATACTDLMSLETFSGGIALMAPLKANYTLDRIRNDNGIATVPAKFRFVDPIDNEVFKCGEAVFTAVETEGRWRISGFAYTNYLDRSRCRIQEGNN